MGGSLSSRERTYSWLTTGNWRRPFESDCQLVAGGRLAIYLLRWALEQILGEKNICLGAYEVGIPVQHLRYSGIVRRHGGMSAGRVGVPGVTWVFVQYTSRPLADLLGLLKTSVL